MSKAADRRIHQPRVDLPTGLPAEPQPLEHTGAEVLDEDITALHKLPQNRTAFVTLEVQNHGAFAAIDAQKVGGVSVADERRSKVAGVVAAARLLQASLEGHGITPTDDPLAATISKLNAAVDAASCIGIVTSTRDDPSGLTAWSLGQLVRALAHRKPAFQIPLGAGTAGGGGNAAGFAASCSWRYGAPGAIAAADRDGSEFQPAEADAVRLISRGEVDCVLAVGRPAPPIEAALTAAAVAPSVIRITDITPEPAAVTTVMLGTASLARATNGAMLREDGRLMQLQPLMAPKKPTVDQLLIKLKQAIDAIRPTASTLQPAAFSGESS